MLSLKPLVTSAMYAYATTKEVARRRGWVLCIGRRVEVLVNDVLEVKVGLSRGVCMPLRNILHCEHITRLVYSHQLCHRVVLGKCLVNQLVTVLYCIVNLLVTVLYFKYTRNQSYIIIYVKTDPSRRVL